MPDPGHHSERGHPYASDAYRAELARLGSVASMNRKGDCRDNAVAESFCGSQLARARSRVPNVPLRKSECAPGGRCGAVQRVFVGTPAFELLDRSDFATRAEAERAVDDCIDRYCELQRKESSVGGLSPIEFELRSASVVAET